MSREPSPRRRLDPATLSRTPSQERLIAELQGRLGIRPEAYQAQAPWLPPPPSQGVRMITNCPSVLLVFLVEANSLGVIGGQKTVESFHGCSHHLQ